MLTLTVPVGEESYDEEKEQFVQAGIVLELEHSLVSLSKWESQFRKPFLSEDEKTTEETLWYISEMIQTQNVPGEILQMLSAANLAEIQEYIRVELTATKFYNLEQGSSNEIITSELIYYWMVALNIPFECQYWHLSRLFTLIKVCNVKNAPEKKMSKGEAFRRRRELNEKRRAEAKAKG